MRYSHFLLISLLAGAAAGAFADVLALSSAETFSGRLVRVREGSLIFRTSLQGQMMVPMDHVQSVATEGNFVVTFDDESVRYGQFVVEDGKPALKPLDGATAVPVALGAIREATPLPSSTPREEEAKPPALEGWKTSGELGVQARSGKQHAAEPFASLETRMQQDGRLFEGDLSLERSDPDAFPRWMRGGLYWRDYGDRAWGPYTGVEAQRDTDNQLSVRTGLRLGVGRLFNQLQEDDSHILEGMLGLNLVYEEWNVQDGTWYGPWRDTTASESDLELHLGLKYARALRGQRSLDSSIGLYPSLIEPGEWRAASEAALIVPFGEKLRLKFNILMDYDSDPGMAGVNRWSAGVGASVQVDF